MRREIRMAVAALAAAAVGAAFAGPYARLVAPYYAGVARLIALGHPWQIVRVDLDAGAVQPGRALTLVGEVRRSAHDPVPAARVVTRLAVGEAVEGAVVFWTVLLLWPATSWRQRLFYCAAGIPAFAAIEALTTAVQLLHALAEASEILAGNDDPLTLWERWSRFLESGGRFATELVGALLTIALVRGVATVRHTARQLPAG
jgi:hypothetical protein